MPKIRAGTVEAHADLVWSDIVAALDSLLAERSFDAVSLADVAERVGMTRTAIYNYAKHKDVLLAEATARASRASVETVREIVQRPVPAVERLEDIVTTLLQLFTSSAVRVALGRHLTGLGADAVTTAGLAPLEALLKEVGSVITDGISRGEFRAVEDVPLTVDLLGATVLAAGRHVVPEPGSVTRLSAVVTDLLVRALR